MMYIPIPMIINQLLDVTTEVYYKEKPMENIQYPCVVLEDLNQIPENKLKVVIWNQVDDSSSTRDFTNKVLEKLKNLMLFSCDDAYFRLKITKNVNSESGQSGNVSGQVFTFREAVYFM